MEEIKEILEKLKLIRTETKLKVTDTALFEQGIDIFLSKQIGKQQDKRAGVVDKTIKNPTAPMSEKQRFFLEKNGYQGDMDLSMSEASALIDAFIKKSKGGAEEYGSGGNEYI